jgi:hypothetical protein
VRVESDPLLSMQTEHVHGAEPGGQRYADVLQKSVRRCDWLRGVETDAPQNDTGQSSNVGRDHSGYTGRTVRGSDGIHTERCETRVKDQAWAPADTPGGKKVDITAGTWDDPSVVLRHRPVRPKAREV